MSDAENFLSRWSRRKVEQTAPVEPRPTAEKSAGAELVAAPVAPATRGAEPDAEFDPSTLPSIGSLHAQSDIRAFLAPGVPAEITRSALRHVWAADPAIRDFVGLAENSWDFTSPGAVHGFDALQPAEIVELAKQFLQGQLPSVTTQQMADGSPSSGAPTQTTHREPTYESPGHPQPEVALIAAAPSHGDVMQDGPMLHCENQNAVLPKEAADRDKVATAGPRHHGGALPR